MLTNTTRPQRLRASLRACAAIALAALPAALIGCASGAKTEPNLRVIAEIPGTQITGVAVDQRGRLFVNSPRWHEGHTASVFEVLENGELREYPDAHWNQWSPEDDTSDPRNDPAMRWVCVQALHVDQVGRLWVLDPGAPGLGPVVPGAPKLVWINTREDRVERIYRFSPEIAPDGSYLNDVRVDTLNDVAFITDSGLGAIVVVHLRTGEAHRFLDGHESTQAESTVTPIIGGRPWRTHAEVGAGDVPQVHADGLAIDFNEEYLYWQALTARTLYRAPLAVLSDPNPDHEQIASSVERVGRTVVTDAMEADADGNIYFTALERSAITYRTPRGRLVDLVRDRSIAWPDSFAWGADGRTLYFTTAQIHLTTPFTGAPMPTEPYRVFAVETPAGRNVR